MLSIFASLVEYECERILEKIRACQQLAAAQGKHISHPKGLGVEDSAKVRKIFGKGLSVIETTELTGISLCVEQHY